MAQHVIQPLPSVLSDSSDKLIDSAQASSGTQLAYLVIILPIALPELEEDYDYETRFDRKCSSARLDRFC